MRSTHFLAALCASTSLAYAQPDPGEAPPAGDPPVAGATMTTTSTERLTLPKGRFLVRALVEVGLFAGAAFDPISLAPDVWYGVDDKITVGLVHSSSGATGLIGGFGSSLCLTGDLCGDVYNNVGVEGRYHLKDGAFTFAAAGGLHVRGIDPLQLALKLGIVGRYRPSAGSKLAIDVAPSLTFGLTEREPDGSGGMGTTVESNKETIALPATAWYLVIPKLSLGAQLAVVTPLEGAADSFTVPLSLAASYAVSERLVVDLAFSLLAVVGGELVDATGFDARTLTIGGSYAL